MTRYKVTLVVFGNNDVKEHRSGDVVADGMDGALDIVSAWIKRTGTIVQEIFIETDTNVISDIYLNEQLDTFHRRV